MGKFLKSLFGSKKFVSTLLGIGTWVVGRVLKIDSSDLIPAVALFGAHVVGQGIADNGKEAKKIEMQAIEVGLLPDNLPSVQSKSKESA